MERDTRTEREKEVDEIVNAYIDILNAEGAESKKELAFLRKYAGDPEIVQLLRSARAVSAMFDAFGRFPNLSSLKGPLRSRRR